MKLWSLFGGALSLMLLVGTAQGSEAEQSVPQVGQVVIESMGPASGLFQRASWPPF